MMETLHLRPEDLVNTLLASCSFPAAFESLKVVGNAGICVDGCFVDMPDEVKWLD